jgi:hypothetical protein
MKSKLGILILASLAVSFLLGVAYEKNKKMNGRYELIVRPADPDSQLGLDSLYRIDTSTGQIDWLAANVMNQKPMTIISWPSPSEDSENQAEPVDADNQITRP